jgi:hypothetical protein
MDQLFDQVRDRTADLRRVAEAVRRERDLRAPRSTVAATGTPNLTAPQAAPVAAAVKVPTADGCDGACTTGPARQAA